MATIPVENPSANNAAFVAMAAAVEPRLVFTRINMNGANLSASFRDDGTGRLGWYVGAPSAADGSQIKVLTLDPTTGITRFQTDPILDGADKNLGFYNGATRYGYLRGTAAGMELFSDTLPLSLIGRGVVIESGTNVPFQVSTGGVVRFQISTAGVATFPGGVTIPSNATATTQSPLDNSTKVATTAYTDAAVAASSAGFIPAGYITGLKLSNNVSDANNDIDIATGQAQDESNNGGMVLASAITKRLDAAWTVGTNQGGLDTGTKAISTWYHVWLIKRLDTGVVDVLFSLSATTPTMPTNYTLKRRIGAIYNNSSNAIDAFLQVGDLFYWNTNPTPVVSNTGVTSANGVAILLRVPTGLTVEAIFNWWFADVTSTQIYFSSLLTPDLSVVATQGRADGLQTGAGGQKSLLTNTSGQIRARIGSGSSGQAYITTVGWRDPRGQY